MAERRTVADEVGRLDAFVRGWSRGEVTVGPPLVCGPLPRAAGEKESARLADAVGGEIARFWRDELLAGAPPVLVVTPWSLWVLAAFHDLHSLALRPDAGAARDLGAFVRSLPDVPGTGDALAAHSVLRHGGQAWAKWPEPARATWLELAERSPLTRCGDLERVPTRSGAGLDAVMDVPALHPLLRRWLMPATPGACRPAGAILALLAEGRGCAPRRDFVLSVYDAWFYHHAESIPLPEGRGERLHWPLLADLERLLGSADRAENEEGKRRFVYFDPLLEIVAASPAALERYPNITREALESLAALARRVARGERAGLAFAP